MIDPLRKQIDGLLAEISAKKNAIAFMEKSLQAELDRVAAQWDPGINAQEGELKAIEAELVGMLKFNKAKLFDGVDRVDFKNGAVLRQVSRPVKRVKKFLQRLKAAGKEFMIKTVESVDWDQVEKLGDEELHALGTKRVPKEEFSYDLKGAA
jgi:hypothetical protein